MFLISFKPVYLNFLIFVPASEIDNGKYTFHKSIILIVKNKPNPNEYFFFKKTGPSQKK